MDGAEAELHFPDVQPPGSTSQFRQGSGQKVLCEARVESLTTTASRAILASDNLPRIKKTTPKSSRAGGFERQIADFGLLVERDLAGLSYLHRMFVICSDRVGAL
jgi:hypothetical protein